MSLTRAPLVVAVLALIGSGCAFTPETIRLEPDLKDLTALPAGAARGELRVVIADLRTEPDEVVAHKINGFGMQGASITSDAPLTEVLARSVTAALEARGFTIGGPTAPALVIELLVLSHEFRVGFWVGKSEALIVLLATLRDPGNRELWRQVINEQYTHDIQLATGPNVKKAYEHALAQALERLVMSESFRQALSQSAAPPSL